MLIPKPETAPRIRLVCLPHAGAGASTYFGWGLPLQRAGIEVRAIQYPGRERRFKDPAISDAKQMVAALADHWTEIAGTGHCAIYGHSMGAFLAFELTAELLRRNSVQIPIHLFVGGHEAVHLPYRAPRVHTLPDDEFLPAVSRHFGGIPADLMEEPEIAAIIAATLRNDFTLVENYTWSGAGPVPIPITAMGGSSDPWKSEEEIASWRRHTTGEFRLRMFQGGHFFNVTSANGVLDEITETLVNAET